MNIFNLRTTIAAFTFIFFSSAYPSDILKLNEGLPVMVDSKTELNDISFDNMTVTYTYQLKHIDIKDAMEQKEIHRNFIQHNACNDGQIQCLFQKDLEVDFIYKIKDKDVLQVRLNKDFCQGFIQQDSRCVG
ncbi:MAG TPA: hypothetical protein PK657_03975 [Legionella sp.]|nr:hypothetical protein [Legionella sp.]